MFLGKDIRAGVSPACTAGHWGCPVVQGKGCSTHSAGPEQAMALGSRMSPLLVPGAPHTHRIPQPMCRITPPHLHTGPKLAGCWPTRSKSSFFFPFPFPFPFPCFLSLFLLPSPSFPLLLPLPPLPLLILPLLSGPAVCNLHRAHLTFTHTLIICRHRLRVGLQHKGRAAHGTVLWGRKEGSSTTLSSRCLLALEAMGLGNACTCPCAMGKNPPQKRSGR